MVEKGKSRGISRREFLKDAGLVVGGAAVGAAITYPLVPKAEEVVEVIKEVEVTKYKCPYCGATLDTFDALKAHVTAQHPAEAIPEEVPKYVCPYCSAESDTFAALKAHVAAEHPPEVVEPAFEPEETSYLIPGPDASEMGAVDVKNGKIVRIRPLHYDERYTKEEIAPAMWKLEARGKTFESRMQTAPCYLALSYKKRVYSPNRILYPLKRVDWEPGGDPAKINPQNRGKSKFKRITWDEAATIIASEIKRVQDKYGELGLCMKTDSYHREKKSVQGGGRNSGGTTSVMMRHAGEFTSSLRNADSWEGWYYGSMHVWGTGHVGLQRPQTNILLDISENTDMLVYQGCDWVTTSVAGSGGYAERYPRWFNHLGIKQVYISPDVNYQNAANPDKWIPVLPGRDDCLQIAIIYTWLDEGTWDKDYVATHVVGMDKIEDYVMGREDGVPKTPAWASPRCGVPEWTIKALARNWAKNRTSTCHGCGGPYIRGPYTHECARFEAILLGMQGLGKPGVSQSRMTPAPGLVVAEPPITMITPAAWGFGGLAAAYRGTTGLVTKQIIARTLLHNAISDGHSEQWGTSSCPEPVENQFVKYTYPAPEAEGGTEFHLIWQDHACQTACWNDGNEYIHALRSPKIECHIIQHIWMENDCLFADIILPVNTNIEEEDIVEGSVETARIAYYKEPVKPVGESKSDYEAALEVAKKLEMYGGRYADLYNKYTEGKTVEEWIKLGFERSGATDYITWEKFKEKGYLVAPYSNPDWKELPRGLIKFYEDPVKNPLKTPSGKLEFYSERLAENFPDDMERGPYPRYVIGGPGWTHDESLEGERCKKYPLLLESTHVRWRVHVQCDDVPWLREIPTCKVKGPDGYMYEPLWINPVDAAKRGIKHGDIVKMYNDRGTELHGAFVTERMIPGAVHADHGARVDMIACEDDEYSDRETKWINRGGTDNTISPLGILSQNCPGMCVSSYLVEVEKLDPAEMEEWRKKYPESFARDYDPAYGLLFGGWVEGGMK